MTQLPLGNGHYQSASPVISNQLCVNWYPNYPQSDALATQTLLPTPGIPLLTVTEEEANRGGIVFGGNPYVVTGNILFRIDEIIDEGVTTYESVALGTITGSGRVSIAKNNTQICIVVPGSNAYIFSDAGGLEQIVDAGFSGPANVVVYLGGFFIFATDTILFSSAINDGLSYNALDFASAEVDPDNIVSLHVYKNELYVLGVDTTEVFSNVGNPEGFPLQRIEGFIIDKGCVGAFAVVDYEDSFAFVGSGANEQPAMWMVSGSDAQKISTIAIDTAIDSLSASELATTVALSYAQDGAYFAVFSFTADTFVYDSTASSMAQRSIWHKRESIVSESVTKWRVSAIMEAFGRLIVADVLTGNIGELDLDTSQEYGNRVNRSWSSSPISKEDLSPLFFRKLEVNVENGLAPEGEEPVLDMAISEDGGKTYGNVVSRSLGKIGEYNTRMIWQRLGRIRRYFTVRLSFSGNFRCVIIRTDAEIA